MIIYLHSKCSTCQEALSFLEKKKIPFVRKDIVSAPPSLEELQKMLDFQQGNIKKLLNTSGILYREMQLSKKLSEKSHSQILNLLSQHGMLIKRPFLLAEDFGLLGFKEAVWTEKF